jgi:teichoic acid transport system permease protein
MTDRPSSPNGGNVDLAEQLGSGDAPDVLGAASTQQIDRDERSRRARRRAAAEAAEAERTATAAVPFEPTGIVHVFQPGGGSREPLGQYLRSVWERRAFMVELAKADLRGSRSNTALGRIWGVLDPLFQAAIYYFLFRVIGGSSGRPIDFLPVLVAGIFLLTLTTSAINDAGRSLRRSKSLLLNSAFPRAMLPMVSLYRSLLAFVPSIFVVAFCYLVMGGEPGPELLYLPLLFSIQVVLNIGIALLVSTIVVMVRDASNLLSYITRVLFFATPVIYPVDRLPEAAHRVLQWQPLFPLFHAYQRIFGGDMPGVGLVLQSAAWAVVLVVVGVRVFRSHEHEFAMRL